MRKLVRYHTAKITQQLFALFLIVIPTFTIRLLLFFDEKVNVNQIGFMG